MSLIIECSSEKLFLRGIGQVALGILPYLSFFRSSVFSKAKSSIFSSRIVQSR